MRNGNTLGLCVGSMDCGRERMEELRDSCLVEFAAVDGTLELDWCLWSGLFEDF